MAWSTKAVGITVALVVLLYVACEAHPEYEARESGVAGRQKREDVTTEMPMSTSSPEEATDEECNGSGKGQGGKHGKGKGKCKGKGKAKGKNKKEEGGERRKRDLEDASIFEDDQELMDALFGGNFN
ncbi:Protein of unknown function [Gryllus bimaculatus]|nr:Protein of unknown function [Gryllus bimaculatus]